MDRSIDLMLKNQPVSPDCNLLLEPVTKWISSMEINRKLELIEMGEKAAREQLLPFFDNVRTLGLDFMP
jgi:hypothetical protein